MNLSEKLAAADGAAATPPAEEAPPPRNRRATDPGGPAAAGAAGTGSSGEKRGGLMGDRRAPGGSAPPGKHPLRRASDRGALEEAWKQSKQKVQAKVLAEIAPTAADLSPDELREKVRSTVNEILEREDIGISPIERQRFVEEMLEDSLGYGPLEALLSDGSITEIMCNAYDEIWIERKGKIERSEIVFTSPHQYRRIIDRMVHGVGRRVDESSPMVDARLADGSRINAIVPPLALRGPVLTVRKFPERALVMQDLINLGSLTMDAAVFLEALVRGKISMVVVGGTGTGKTTMLNVLSNFIPDGERLITIEESAELQIQGAHVVTLETRPANAEGTGEVRIRDLVRNSLRMRPDRIIVGECRGSETLDMLQAMNTGHAGSMTTVHANTPRELLGRLETMVMMGGVELPQRAIREQIVMAVGILVQLQRTAEGPRVVHSITEIQGMEGDTVLLQDIFHRVDTAQGMGRLVPTGLRPKILDELSLAGVDVPAHIFRNDSDALLGSGRRESRPPPPPGPARPRRGAALGGALRDPRPPSRGREVSGVVLGALQSSEAEAFVAAVLIGGGLALAVVAAIMRVRTKQRTLAQILDDTMGTADVPVEVVSESPERGELTALTVRISGLFGRIDTTGALEQRLERAAIPLRSGEYIVISGAIALDAGRGRRGDGRLHLRLPDRDLPGRQALPGTCRRRGPGSGSRRCRSSCRTRWRSWRRPSRAARPSSAPSTCTGVTPRPRCRTSWTGSWPRWPSAPTSSSPSRTWPSVRVSRTSSGPWRPCGFSSRPVAAWRPSSTRWPTSCGPGRRCAGRSRRSRPKAACRATSSSPSRSSSWSRWR